MNTKTKHGCRRLLAMLLVVISVMGLIAVPAFAGQEDGYHDPAERWMNASNRTNELDVNATVTHETFHCYVCQQPTSFQVWRTPEYTKDGQTAMTRNVRYSDGTLASGSGTGTILDGTPGVNATYTGYHWTKACCETCGTMNANMGIYDYSFSKNVYWLYDCATAFTEYLDDVVTYEYVDSTYHKKIVDGGSYCEFCYGTRHTHSETLEPHDLHVDIIPQLGNQRYAIVKNCHDCEYTSYSFVAAKAVVADYYGVVDGQAHTLVISDLSDAGVTAKIRYGNTAETCTNSIINYAFSKGYLHQNPLADTKNMGVKDKRVQVWTAEEYERFAYCAMNYPEYYYAYEVLYWCGLREGEMLALTLSDVDLMLGTISITKTYQRVNKRDVITTPKTPSSVRTVSMPGFLCDELQEYIDMLYEPQPTDRIFKISKSKLTDNFHNLTDEAGLKRITVHGLRHSHVSLLISKKYDIFEISKRIGHKSIKTTQDIYGHLFDDVQKAIANDLDSIRRG